MKQHLQIFQTFTTRRWNLFKWTVAILIFLLVLMLGALAITLWKSRQPDLPVLHDQAGSGQAANPAFTARDNTDKALPKKYSGFCHFIDKQGTALHNPTGTGAAPIRAAFYVAWDAQSWFSLHNNIQKLNMVLPEWLFIDPVTDSIKSNIDARGYALIKQSGVRVLPMLSNFHGNDFDGAAVHRIISNTAKRKRLINSLAQFLQSQGFAGVNIDFEELAEQDDAVLVRFQQELYTTLHAKGLLVTQDIAPFNEDYNYKELAKYNDYIFLMAYDQHYADSKPGPISAQQWIEAALDEAARDLPSQKIILCLAAYGYDWPRNGKGETVTYQEALSTAAENKAAVSFDNGSYNLHYSYSDDNDWPHDVYFTDAATNFNTLRFAAEYGAGGVALWRLGSEDNRVWQFYNLDLRRDSLPRFDFTTLTHTAAQNDVDYIGEGEVLDVKSTPQPGSITLERDSTAGLISEENYVSLPSMFVVQKYGQAAKKVVLTFDDGPDPDYTPRILDILAKEKVPASFFVVGMNAEQNIPLVKRIYREGYEIGNHSFTHPNMATVSPARAVLERRLTRVLIECITGHSTLLFRAPYNADSEPETMEELKPVADSRTENYLTIGESIDPQDWEPGVTKDSIVQRIIHQQGDGSIILLHDAGGNREATIAALPEIIHYYKAHGYRFTTVADLLGRQRDELMPAVTKGAGYYLMQVNYLLAEAGYYTSHILGGLFGVFIVIGVGRMLLLAILAIRQRRREKQALAALPAVAATSLVSVIIPAYNEEVNAVESLRRLLQTTYTNTEFIFVDDGSKDDTYAVVSEAFAHHPQVQILSKPNGGKASALNFGIAHAAGNYVVCIDADTYLLPDAIGKLMRHFHNPAIGAVAGNVRVGNEVNLLTRWQYIEYATAQNFERRAMASVNAITVVPGAIGAFRKEAIEKAGGFTTDTLAEDCDLTLRILQAGYTVTADQEAVAVTEAPETLRMFLKQRLRWSFGMLQTWFKHRRALGSTRHKGLGWVALPNMLLFQFIIPLFSPLADLLMLVSLATGNAEKTGLYYLLFLLADAGVALLAFAFEKINTLRLVWLLPQRLAYRWLMMYVLFKSYARAIRGELQSWGVLKRSGFINKTYNHEPQTN